jgi:ankyrin repeat domain-containing protein 50
MTGISTAIQANPDPSSIIVGAVQLAISLAVEFVNFFDQLTDMLNCFNDYLGTLAEYAKASDTELMRQTVVSVYGDLIEFCRAARHVFVDSRGVKREWISMRTFLRVQWEPFEGIFGDTETKFKHHLNVLHHSAKA